MKFDKYEYLESFETICSCHKEIMRLSENNDPKIYALSEKAYEMGIALENRLKKYRKSIERLGFKRIKK